MIGQELQKVFVRILWTITMHTSVIILLGYTHEILTFQEAGYRGFRQKLNKFHAVFVFCLWTWRLPVLNLSCSKFVSYLVMDQSTANIFGVDIVMKIRLTDQSENQSESFEKTHVNCIAGMPLFCLQSAFKYLYRCSVFVLK